MYSQLKEKKNEIRILLLHPEVESDSRLVCTLETISLDDKVERERRKESVVGEFFLDKTQSRFPHQTSVAYEAVSYIGETLTAKTLFGSMAGEVQIWQNLWFLLHDFRTTATTQKEPVRLWINAICINQEDLVEKGWQIPKMKFIYELAKRVVVWLGPRNTNSSLAMQLLLTKGKKPWNRRRV